MDRTISESTNSEADLLASLIRDAFADVATRFNLNLENAPTHPSNCTAEWIENALAKGVRYFLLRVDEQPVGCVALEKASDALCYLERLAVLPGFRRQGCGAALVNHLVDKARAIGTERVEIGIISAHVELKSWYEKLGFVFLSTARFPQLPFEVTFMRKSL